MFLRPRCITGISRLYETFGNGGADTEKRILAPDEYQADVVQAGIRRLPGGGMVAAQQQQFEETALLTTISYFRAEQPAMAGELLPQGEEVD